MRYIVVIVGLIINISAYGQYASVNATVTDSDGQTWNNGTYQITFVPPPGYNGTIYTFNGVGWTPTVKQGSISITGILSVSNVERNDYILPANSRWRFTICPNASVTCTSITTVNVNQTTIDITSQLNLQTVRFPASQTSSKGSYGYADIEVNPTPPPGGYYFNVTTQVTRVWNGSTWQSSGGGNTIPGGTPNQVQFNGNGVFAGDAGLTYDKSTGTLTSNQIKVGSTVTAQTYGNAMSPLTADATCALGQYWIAPIAGTVNKWRQCTNGTLSDMSSNGSSFPGCVSDGANGISCTGTATAARIVASTPGTNGFINLKTAGSPTVPATPGSDTVQITTPNISFSGYAIALPATPPSGTNTVLSCPTATGTPPVSQCVWTTFSAGTGGGGGGGSLALQTYLSGGNGATSNTTFATNVNSSPGGPTFNLVAGNSLLVFALIDSSGHTISSIVDASGCTLTAVGSMMTIGTVNVQAYLGNSCPANGADITTVTINSGGTYNVVASFQISGGPVSYDTEAYGNTTSNTIVQTSSFNTTYNNDVVCAIGFINGSFYLLTAGSGYTLAATGLGGLYLSAEYKTLTTPQTGIIASFTYTSSVNMDIFAVAVGK